MILKHMLLSTDTENKEVAPQAYYQSQQWNLAAWPLLVAGGTPLAKISGHILMRRLISVSPVYPPCSRESGLVYLSLASGEVLRRLEAKAV